jgi:hypothetical protein
LENDPAAAIPEDEDRDRSIIEPATNNNLVAQGNEGGDEIIVPLSNIFNGDLEAQEVEVKRRVDFTLQMTMMDEVDWIYGAASCHPWGKPWRRCLALGEWEGLLRDMHGPLDRDL